MSRANDLALSDNELLAIITAFASKSIAPFGYQKLPNGLIIQWGSTAVIGVGADVVTTLPLAFPSAFYTVFLTSGYTAGTNAPAWAAAGVASLSSFVSRAGTGANGYSFFAIGK